MHWGSDVGSDRYGEAWWKESLRMSRNTFNVLCQELRPHIERQDTCLRMPIGVEKRVVVTILKLATNVEYWTLSALFGLGHFTVCVIVVKTCTAIAKHLLPRYVNFSTGERLRDIVSMFETCWRFPQVARAIDGT